MNASPMTTSPERRSGAAAGQQAERPEPTHGLPSPRDYPQSDVVIYDGNCVFCLGQVRNLHRLDGKHRLAFISLHDPFVSRQFPDLSHDALMSQIYLIPAAEQGYSSRRLGGAEVLRYLTTRLPLLWVFAPLLYLPGTLPFWQWGYQLVARRRYRIAGKRGMECDEDGTCHLHFDGSASHRDGSD